MLQLATLREERTAVIEALKKRGNDPTETIDRAIALDEERRRLQTQLDRTLADSNRISKEIGILFKQGDHQKATLLKERSLALKETSKGLQHKLTKCADSVNDLLYQIPNTPHSSVSKGSSEEDNEEIYRCGDIPTLSEGALPHWELAKKYDLIDFEAGNKVTGTGFPVYKGKGARLQRAMVSYFLDKNTRAGYTEYQPPYLVNATSGFGTGQLPDKEGQMYHIGNEDLYLIPTAEVPITNLFRDMLISEKELPILCTAYTPCFRREAGSYGAHVRGLNRLHQFDKVEIVRIEHPEHSYEALETMVAHIKGILNELKLPYRILRLCGGDLGFTSALTYDFEVYSTAQERWLEISSASNFETYQANRLKLRFKDAQGKKRLLHTLNGSSLALPRVLAGILENYQTAHGIHVPEVLIPYTGFDRID